MRCLGFCTLCVVSPVPPYYYSCLFSAFLLAIMLPTLSATDHHRLSLHFLCLCRCSFSVFFSPPLPFPSSSPPPPPPPLPSPPLLPLLLPPPTTTTTTPAAFSFPTNSCFLLFSFFSFSRASSSSSSVVPRFFSAFFSLFLAPHLPP